MPNYSDPNMINNQRNSIVQALMGIANPPPPTSMPGAQDQYGAGMVPPTAGPTVPAAGGMPSGGMGGMTGASPQMAQTQPLGLGAGGGGAPPPGGVPLSPTQSMPMMPGGGRAGLPYGPVPKTPQLVGQPLNLQQPGSQITPAPPQGY